MDLKSIFVAVKQLVSPVNTDGGDVLQKLEHTLQSYSDLLKERQHLLERVQHYRDNLCHQSLLTEGKDQNGEVYWKFTQEGLCLLLVLNDTLLQLYEEDRKSRDSALKPPKHPPAPKALLSVSDQKLIQSFIQFIVLLGIYPYLLPGVDSVLKLRYKSTNSVLKVKPVGLPTLYLCKCCQVLSTCFANPILGPQLLPLYLSDVLSGLLQICYEPSVFKAKHESDGQDKCTTGNSNKHVPAAVTAEAVHVAVASPTDAVVRKVDLECVEDGVKIQEREKCMEVLQKLLVNTYQPLVVKELLALQSLVARCTGEMERPRLKWLQKSCGQLLSERLMHKNGVQNVLNGIFESTAGSGLEDGSEYGWKKCQSIARIITRCPSCAASVEDYYSLICPQVLDILRLPMAVAKGQFVRVTVAIISNMMSQQIDLAMKYLFEPLIQPLKCLGEDVTMSDEEKEMFGKNLYRCIEDLHKICGVIQPSSPFNVALIPYLPLLFNIWSIGLAHSIPTCSLSKDVLFKLLSVSESSVVVSFLEIVSGVSENKQFKTLHPTLALNIINDAQELSLVYQNKAHSLGVDEMERIGNCVLEILKTNVSDVVGVFFLQCLDHIAEELYKETNYTMPNVLIPQSTPASVSTNKKSSTVLLECEQNLGVESYNNTLVLYIIAALCEHMSNDVLNGADLRSLLLTISTIVGCHSHYFTQSSKKQEKMFQITGPSLESLLGGPITLSISFGLLSAILGGAREVSKVDRPLLTAMLPLLESISSKYPDEELRSLANDLRVCIATLGAVWTTEMNEKVAELKPGGGLTKQVKHSTVLKDDFKSVQTLGDQSNATEASPKSTHKGTDSLYPESQIKTADKNQSTFQEALQDLKDPLLPVRGHGLIALRHLIESKDTETLTNSIVLLSIFKENLKHSDSYIYLAALNGLVALASSSPANLKKIMALLCQEYAQFKGPPSREEHLDAVKETGQLKAVVTSDTSSQAMIQHSAEFRMKLGEALVKLARDCNELLPQYLDQIMASILSNVRDQDPLIRASSLSYLADVCAIIKFSFGQIQHEVLACITSVLKTDKEDRVRQAALVVLKLLIKNISKETVTTHGESLLEIYRLLKHVESNERDGLTQAHAQAALGEMDTLMRAFIFPEQNKQLTKKITILDKL